ncbi:uncharacterized protein LOC132861311 [Tachysurus vachellii]|uniref:uncharacterized protein LOC132861311 n=1 Tax=Tachysurus vachellii TaxID=175792 RepID=UPI00296AB2EC|nr:uncharacterized protein LOC132861311 [Tachysurus vachellii]
MAKLEQLNVFLSERLSAAVKEILDTVSRMMKEYEEETARIMKENDYLKEMLKVTGCSFTETNPGGIPSVLFGKQDSASNLQQEAEPLESLSQQREAKKENTSIKSEHLTPRYPANADSEPETRPTDDTAEPPHCTPLLNSHTVDQDVIDFEFPIKVKVESMNIESHSGDATDNLDASNQSWSPQNWDMFSERSYQNRVQQGAGLHPYTTEGSRSTETTIQNHPVEFQAAFSYTNRTICNNRLHCTSRYCELQKRTTSKSSPVWQYFSLKEGDCSKAVCLMCNAVISRGVKEYTTSALLKHLRMKHGKC